VSGKPWHRIVQELQAFASACGQRCQSERSTDGVDQFSVYSAGADPTYRYAFATCWSAAGPFVLWIGLNPAKGDLEQRRRPTLERCIRWSKDWKAGGLLVGNLFAARHNKPNALRTMRDPEGPHNDDAVRVLSSMAERTVVAWGGNGASVSGRAAVIVPLLNKPLCLGVTASGQPRHPLYVRGETPARPWSLP